ncbi:mechanosensitive ion channel family protein [Erythrobacter sp.]|uniref:mechanosensitive ion channel family protein n=1 Tax=Erythrobacter sp. TaxID=1042 RepID=UPI002EC5EA5C|nr:mechanosensitive ion channel domain-containing protein [Erythrobacter sp.]
MIIAWLVLLLAAPSLAQTSEDVPAAPEPHVYEVDPINTGLPAADPPLDLETPQSVLESFLDAGFEEDWTRAAHALDLAELPEGEQARLGPQLARQTFEIVRRSVVVDWRSIPDRPDAVDVNSTADAPLSGEPRRNLALWYLRAEGRDYSIRLERLQAPGEDPMWMFSRQTVENIPALYQRYGPTRFERSLPTFLRAQAFWTLAWWEVLALPIVFLLALGAAALTYKGISRLRSSQSDEGLIDGVLRAIQIPAALAVLAGTFALLRAGVFNFSGTVAAVLDPLQITLFVAAVVAIALSAIDTAVQFASRRRTDELEDPDNEDARDYFTKLSAGRRLITVFVVLVAGAVVLLQTDITNTLGFSLLASAGFLGLILVFAARQALGDLMASIQIAFAKTARIGDAVHWQGQWCYVERIGFTHLRLRTWDERRMMAPVSSFVNTSFENWTKTDPNQMMHVELKLDHRADVDALRKEFARFVEDADDIIEKDEAKVAVIDHDAKAMTVRFMARAKDPKIGWAMHCRLREEMIAAAARLDAGTDGEPAPAFFSREREVQIDERHRLAAE